MNEHNRLTAEENRAFYRMAVALVIPMALQNLINVGVTTADVVMLGKVGETALSGASLAGQVQFIMNLIFFGLTSGASVLTAQYWGKRDVRTIEKVFGISFVLCNGNRGDIFYGGTGGTPPIDVCLYYRGASD